MIKKLQHYRQVIINFIAVIFLRNSLQQPAALRSYLWSNSQLRIAALAQPPVQSGIEMHWKEPKGSKLYLQLNWHDCGGSKRYWFRVQTFQFATRVLLNLLLTPTWEPGGCCVENGNCPVEWSEEIPLSGGKKCCDCPDYISQLILRKPPQTSRIIITRNSSQPGQTFRAREVIFVRDLVERKVWV